MPRTKAPTADVTALQAENERLKSDNAAFASRQDQMLDMLVELQDKVSQIQTVAPAAGALSMTDEQAAYEAEKAAVMAEFKDYPLIEVLDRRMAEGQNADNEIRLMDEPGIMEDPKGAKRKWHLRWFNFAKEGRAHAAQREGYMKVTWDELRTSEALGGLDRKDEYVRKGDRGLEVLHKIPERMFDLKKDGDRLRQRGLMTSESKLRHHISNEVAARAGAMGDNADQAGSFINGQVQMDIKEMPSERFTA